LYDGMTKTTHFIAAVRRTPVADWHRSYIPVWQGTFIDGYSSPTRPHHRYKSKHLGQPPRNAKVYNAFDS
jgi:hypothetical protein